mgnify:CR=1 FL=1
MKTIDIHPGQTLKIETILGLYRENPSRAGYKQNKTNKQAKT